MAVGILTAGLGAFPSVGSTPLANADLPTFLEVETFRILPLALIGDPTEVLRVMPAEAHLGLLSFSHGHAVFEKIHVIPRTKDLGAVGTLQEFSVEVWNAYRYVAQSLQSITAAGAGNVTVLNPLGFPTHFPATASRLFTIQVPGEGDPVINALVTFIFVGIPSAGATDVTVLGFRMIALSFDPNRATDVVESFGYVTDVLEAFDGTEQRVQLRASPLGTIAFSLLLEDLRDVQEMGAILYGNQARAFGVPRWPFLTLLTAPALTGQLELLCDTTHLPFEVGGLCLVRSGPRTMEAHTIEAVAADRITLAFPLVADWAIGAQVLPLVIGRLSTEEVFAWESLSIGALDLRFSIDRFTP